MEWLAEIQSSGHAASALACRRHVALSRWSDEDAVQTEDVDISLGNKLKLETVVEDNRKTGATVGE